MAAKQTTRKRTTRKKTTRRKPTKRTPSIWHRLATAVAKYRKNWLGLLIVALAGLGTFKLGLVGALVANLARLVVGNLYPVFLIGIALVGIWWLLAIPRLKISFRNWLSLLCLSAGSLLGASLLLFNGLGIHVQLVQITWETVLSDLMRGQVHANAGGGLIGAVLLAGCAKLFSWLGATIIAGLLLLTGVLLLFRVNVVQVGQVVSKWVHAWVEAGQAAWHRHQLARKTAQTAAKPQPSAPESPVTPQATAAKPQPQPTTSADEPPLEEQDVTTPPLAPRIQVASEVQPQPVVRDEPASSVATTDADAPTTEYQLPTVDLLEQVPPVNQKQESQTASHNTEVLRSTLQSFGIDAQVKDVRIGPSVTEYELEPAIGVKVSKIVNLSDDLALALAAKDIRIEAPIPGKSLIGIEVPNQKVATVSFREVFEQQTAADQQRILSVPLGKDVNGQVISCDLTRMPHLLIAGSTGSGKSVAINGMLTSLLLKANPDQVKLMLIDPKRVELGVYNGIPHLLSPVVSDPKKAARALNKVVNLMEQRYELFAKNGQRKIDGYNEMIRKKRQTEATTETELPYIVVVVDELADLMMTVSNEVESAIIRLAQMGRAAGVHMVLATQRPSVDVITGLIKANVPSRIAFAVSSGTDSRTILDANGAEKLLGRGDMLYQPIGQTKPNRVQGSYISDTDVEAVIAAAKKEGAPEYDENLVVTDAELEAESEAEEQDPLFDEALDYVVHERKASTSMLQRRFRIGYNRAARIIDDFEQRGYVSPQRGSTPRTVYKQATADE
ncbi:DNA translocase FtsK [Fructilactobacillus myrtifloralis]|uniref:DNA translocase FtsK n=1 Tax=Fructilactobacillus myrtifloralis TaxID=2940301 RepID=A0ABY5BTE8_9LACO|nr:DNA translocase FtsK [Fructilactobacillus myrtifloralis]USS85533.1 DNA translocase FtsK [Fructilactobacillus myrtifloralis]